MYERRHRKNETAHKKGKQAEKRLNDALKSKEDEFVIGALQTFIIMVFFIIVFLDLNRDHNNEINLCSTGVMSISISWVLNSVSIR